MPVSPPDEPLEDKDIALDPPAEAEPAKSASDQAVPGALIVPRGCGEARISSGVYAETGLMLAQGREITDFILDPPVALDPRLNVSAIGVSLIEQQGANGPTGIWHIVDWIGETHYANVWDFLGEASRFGVSRRLPRTLEFEKLGPQSRLLVVHRKAILVNAQDYRTDGFEEDEQMRDADGEPIVTGWTCPHGYANHLPENRPLPCCAGVWAQDIVGGERPQRGGTYAVTPDPKTHVGIDGQEYPLADPRLVRRTMPSFTYYARRAPLGSTPEYQAGFIASFPLTRIAVVDGDTAAQSYDAAARANRLPVHRVDR